MKTSKEQDEYYSRIKRILSAITAFCVLSNITGTAAAQALLPAKKQGYTFESPFSYAAKTPLLNQNWQNPEEAAKISVNLAFAAIPGSLSFEQVKKEAQSWGLSLTEEGYKDIYFSYKQAVVDYDKSISLAAQKADQFFPTNKQEMYAYALKQQKGDNFCFPKLSSSAQNKEEECFDKQVFAQGMIRALIKDATGAEHGPKSKFYWNTEILLYNAPDIFDIIKDFGANAKDTPVLQSIFRQVVKAGAKYTDNDTYKADILKGFATGDQRADAAVGKTRREAEAQKLAKAILGLAVLDVSQQDKNANAQLIYKLLKDSYTDDYGAVVLYSSAAALIAINNNQSYAYLDKFLFEDSFNDGLNKGSFWQSLWSVFDIISVNAWGNKITDSSNRLHGRAGRYNNSATERFTYIDTSAAYDMGFTHFQISLAKDNRKLYNMPYGNIFEDIGRLLAQTNDKRAKTLALKAVYRYKASKESSIDAGTVVKNVLLPGSYALEELKTANKYVSVPLAVGALSGGVSSDAAILKHFYNADWWDLNEGTQRRINNNIASAATAKGLTGFPQRAIDEAKKRRASVNDTVATATLWTDIFIGAIFMTKLVASLPAIAKNAQTLARVANIRAAGKASLLKTVSANLKAQGLSSQAVKLARYNKLTAQNQALKTVAQEQKTAAVKELKAAAVKNNAAIKKPLNPKDIEIVDAGNSTAQIRFKWQAQQAKTAITPSNTQNALTFTVGEGGGGAAATGGSAQSAIKAQASAPKISLTSKVKNVQTPKPALLKAKTFTPVDNARIVKASRLAKWDEAKNIFGQFGRTLRTKSGAYLMGMNLSLLSPSTVSASVKATNGFTLSARGAGLTTELVSGSGKMGLINAGLGGSSYITKGAEGLSGITKAAQTAKTLPVKLPVLTPKYTPFNNPVNGLNYAGFPKYAYLDAPVSFNLLTQPHNALVAKAAALPEGWGLLKAGQAPSVLLATHTSKGLPYTLPKPDAAIQQAGFSDPFIILPFIVAAAAGARYFANIRKNVLGFNQSNIDIKTGMPWSNIRAPKDGWSKNNIPASYINSQGQEKPLPLSFNIDKSIKVKDGQRTVFNRDFRLELHNGVKTPAAIERFMMTLNGGPLKRLDFLDAVKLSGVDGFKLKLQSLNNKQSRVFREHDLFAADKTTKYPISLSTPRNLISESETLFLDQDGNFTAVSNGESRILNNVTFRIPKSEISKVIQVLESGKYNFTFDIRPTANKVLPFMLAFLSATTIMAAAPAFKEIFMLNNFWATTLMGLISFGPAAALPFLGYAYKKWGLVKVMRAATLLTASGVGLAVLSGLHGYGTPATNIPALIGATLGLTMASLANEIKFSTMSPLFDANFDSQKSLSVTSYSLMARSIGTILFMNFPAIFNAIATPLGFAAADRTIAFSALLLPAATYAAASMLKAKLRDSAVIEDANITPKGLIKTFLSSPATRRGATAFILFESFEATMSLLVFELAKQAYALDNVADFAGGMVIYGSMAASRLIAGKLQAANILDAKKTYIASAAASLAGTVMFALGGFGPLGISGAVLGFLGISNFFGPLFNATKARHPDKAGEISLIFFSTTALATISATILGAIMDATTSQMIWFSVPLAAILGALALSSYTITDIPEVREAFKKIGLNFKDPSQPSIKKAKKSGSQNGPDINNPLPN